MEHLTLNTGHSRQSSRSEIDDAVIQSMKEILKPGKHRLPGVPYVVELSSEGSGLLVTVWQVRRPLATIGVAEDDRAGDALWPCLVQVHESLGHNKKVVRPAASPWCGAVLIAPTPGEAAWLGDFGRTIAWAWLEALGRVHKD